jgi:NADH-quinone oxidoreductase subunit G
MSKQVTLTIDGRVVTVPSGTLIVDAAKRAGVDIPVFCYHPKMEPVGMCRQCLVEIGRPVVDRATGEVVKEADGSIKIQFSPKLETSCTTPVSEGMVVLTESEKARAGHKEILEFLLTSHPLDCPVCDKGGECPLQNLTLGYGPGKSRFLYDEKMHLAKHLPLGELIYLDRERCIQCARCVRFQCEVVDEPVIGFYQRGRSIEIASFSEPGFNSYFSGNTSDICPVGALTTADFRFGARPWELKSAASICSQCPVGCNITFNTRREAKSGGQVVVKRVMPRQNEQVNEIWICDKGRFAYHYTESGDRLTRPLVRKDAKMVRASWDGALKLAAEKLGAAKKNAVVLVSGRLSNEDLFNLKELADGLGGATVLYTQMGGGDLTALVGVGGDSNIAELGEGDAILVVASDLQEEAPIWWLRVKQAAKRGATLIVANPRQTKLDKHATFTVRYAYGDEVKAAQDLGKGGNKVSQAFSKAKNAVILFGSEGLGLDGSSALAAACARLLQETGHVGQPNNGLIGVWQRANDQGAWELGFRPQLDLASFFKGKTVYVVAADPAGDDPVLAKALKSAKSVIVQELFQTATTDLAEVVLPAQAYTEREGTYTSGERRVQRFYPAVPARGEARPDYAITAGIGKLLDIELEARSPLLVFNRLAARVKDFEGISYRELAEVSPQWPIIGRGDLYYGGTSYENTQGLGVQLTPAAQRGETFELPDVKLAKSARPKEGELLGVPVTKLYDRGLTVSTSELLHQRIGELTVGLHPSAATGLVAGQPVEVSLNGATAGAILKIDESIPTGVALLPRSMGFSITAPAPVSLKIAKKTTA